LIALVEQFNRTYAGNVTSRGQSIPRLALPAQFQLGDGFSSQDVRLGKIQDLGHGVKLNVFGEVFNALNIANKSSYNFNLNSPGFGQPTQRIGQIFGSGGPRAVQLGARISF